MKEKTKTARIKEFARAGWTNDEILAFVDTTRRYIIHVRWLMKDEVDRKEYKRQWMADKRKQDAEYYSKELAQQRGRDRKRRASL